MKYIQQIRKWYKSLDDYLNKIFEVYNLHRKYALVTLPLEKETLLYQQTLNHIKQLIRKGYQVELIEQQEQKKCECCKCCQQCQSFYEEILKFLKDQKPLKEDV